MPQVRTTLRRGAAGEADALRAFVAELATHPRVTLPYAARDEQHNNAAELLAYLLRKRVA